MTRNPCITVVAEYHDAPAEGINVVSKTLIDDLRAAGRKVRVVPPGSLLQRLPGLLWRREGLTVFTHGPGVRTVLARRILRLLSPTRIIWLATRPDLGPCPVWLKGWRTAHSVICNRARTDLADVARDALMTETPIGIAPERLTPSGAQLWPDLRARGVPIALHVGHLRTTRGLDRLVEIKARLGNQIEVVVVASPTFPPEPGVMQALQTAGVHIDRGFVSAIADVYHSADLYLFPPPPQSEGAIELPLSVLEAVACGLPVVSTAFGALPGALRGVAGVHFVDGAQFADTVAHLIASGLTERPPSLPAALNAHRLAEHVLEIANTA